MHIKGKISTFCLSWKGIISCLVLLLFAWWIGCLPKPLFNAPLATELLDRDGRLLSAAIAEDGQWRMPAADSISAKMYTCVVAFEDRRFRQHPGIDLRSIIRAVRDNYNAGRIVSGGSTLTMQVARMARGNPQRTLLQKVVEAATALRLEVSYSKDELLDFWLNNAPFGGNAVGIEAACRRYYGRGPADLSWAEAATLAVLPNSPALIHPGRNREALTAKRNNLLGVLLESGKLSQEEYELALLEPLPGEPLALPADAPHLLQRRKREVGAGRIATSIDSELQRRLLRAVTAHHQSLAGNQIHNLAVMVSEVYSGRVIAYVGNVPGLAAEHAPAVDLVTAPRSPGSLLKPILYGLAMDAGELLPGQLLADVPTSFQNFRPANFHREFDGAVPADRALARSLNIPFVFLLRDFGVARFQQRLHRFGFRQMGQHPDHYGLSLILGGAEITMEEIHGWFLGLAQQQRNYYQLRQQNLPTDFEGLSAGAGYSVLEALRELERPDENGGSIRFASHRPIAWKTGTSFGFRDAWAVGTTPDYVVSVWAGNADGEGRPGLVGVRAAAPLLFEVFRLLDGRSTQSPKWFERPFDDQREVATCLQTGYLAGPDCPTGEEVWVPVAGLRATVCPYHQLITTTADGNYRTRQDCQAEVSNRSWLVLPPIQAHFYARRNPSYRSPPPWHPDCRGESAAAQVMQIVYPDGDGVLSRIKNWEGEIEPLHFEVAHTNADAEVHWHLDKRFLTTTRTYHNLSFEVEPGNHLLTLVDERGNRLEKGFKVK